MPGQELTEARKAELIGQFEPFLKQHLRIGDPTVLMELVSDPEFRKLALDPELTPARAEQLSEAQMGQVFEALGPHYGVVTNIVDEQMILGRLVNTESLDRPTLSVGCGLALHEVFLSTQGVITNRILG